MFAEYLRDDVHMYVHKKRLLYENKENFYKNEIWRHFFERLF